MCTSAQTVVVCKPEQQGVVGAAVAPTFSHQQAPEEVPTLTSPSANWLLQEAALQVSVPSSAAGCSGPST